MITRHERLTRQQIKAINDETQERHCLVCGGTFRSLKSLATHKHEGEQ